MVNQPTTCVTDQYGMGQGPIRFYNKDEPYYEFTNFYPAPIDLDGKTWPTTEHYFQAQKFIGTSFPEVIRNFERPRQAFDLSRNPTVSRWRRKDWEDIKINIMRKALLAKFTQHKRLRQLLLSTRDNMLIEHTPYDKFWGDGGDGSGENHLGMILMEIRQLLINLQASLRQERVTPDSHREHVQRSASTEKDGQSHLSSSSSSSMDYMNAEAENTHHDQQNHDSHQVQANQDPQNINLTRSPLHPKAAENAGSPPHQQLPTGGEGSPQGKPASATTPNSAPVQMQSEPPVGNLIDLNDAEPPEEDKKNPIMTGKVPQNLKQPLQPVSLGQRVNQAPDTSTNVGKESDKDDQPEQMDTSGPNNIH